MDGLENKVCEVVRDIWSTILHVPISPGDHAVEAARRAQAHRSLTVCVQVTGDWEGSVLLYSTHVLARLMASIMFDCPPDEVSDEDTEDAMGELGNMAAGNIKKAFQGSCGISLPTVVDGVDYRLLVPGSTTICKVLFECEEQPVLVTVLKKEV